MKNERILILGVTGMLGHTLFKEMSKNDNFEVFGTTRNKNSLKEYFTTEELSKIRDGVDADNFETVIRAIAGVQPTIIINCIGIIKQLPISKDPLTAITVNAQLPHRLSLVTRTANARLIHISTDCVFDGKKGHYTEKDFSNAEDLYGKTKFLGEVHYPHCITLRTSIIGHELKTNYSLVDWFMSQKNETNGFTQAIYSGFPTIEMVNIISNYVIPNKELSGLYHVSSNAISKYELLNIIKDVYKKVIKINAFDDFVLDRSINSTKFKEVTGYVSPSWQKLVEDMHYHVMNDDCYKNKFFRK
ncbi:MULTISPECIES: dTDP-4-dehydrorhamnose reductase family protein [unclassified Arcobacter]|uniref:dTDP-4-dehydrorhamnose reductase family protein n=1 Tax=unclassified Arcobacter TaxID=2593671 RepID=UPI003B006CD0|eukprot:TRINITY_DN2437_c0_g2_i1.p1 TRINITY_DN2437_c0_g2~~TRINITY_DN2437_c0_g2_i1.p1  ORF type:complete len:302 (-),score=-45.77 TRINITY_DN2437_c0_g2_i1:440-1345(-)